MKERVMEILTSNKKPLAFDKIFELLKLEDSSDFVNLSKALCELEDEYVIIRNKNDKYQTLEYFHLVKGEIVVKESGFGFVKIGDDLEDIYVSSENRHTALNKDLVLIHVFKNKNRTEGEVQKIIKRNTYILIGTVKKYRGKHFVESVDSRNKMSLFIPSNLVNGAEDGDVVEATVKRYYEDAYDLIRPIGEGKITKVYGDYNDPGMDIKSLILSKGYVESFPVSVMDEVSLIKGYVTDDKLYGRTDLTDKLIVTIDGDDAKDFDDAITVELLENGNYKLGVYIADVSEYVKVNSELDKEAYNRATSVYLPDRVIPMLPKELSNGICSLNEGVIRLVMACEMEIDSFGNIVNHSIFKAYIKSSCRFTYSIVNKIFDGDELLRKQYIDFLEMLEHGRNLAEILYKMRIKRGAFDFESMESKVILDDNLKAIDVVVRTQGISENMIEEFMLIANDCVATTMTWLDVPFIYRVHDEPKEERLNNFIEYCNSIDLKVTGHSPKALAKSLQRIYLDTKDDMTNKVLGTMLIRSMAKAKYQTNNIGHYGLQSECYTHFTSPIRRYPDLLVHRLIKEFLLGENEVQNAFSFYQMYLEDASIQSSVKEKNAENLERDALDIKKAEYMVGKVGNKFEGSISSVTNHGIYVVLDNFIEGLVRFEYLPNDYYIYLEKQHTVVGERSNNNYSLGDRVLVELISTNKKMGQINFKLIKKIKR